MNADTDHGCAARRLGKRDESLTSEGFPLSAAARRLQHISLFSKGGVPTGELVAECGNARARTLAAITSAAVAAARVG